MRWRKSIGGNLPVCRIGRAFVLVMIEGAALIFVSAVAVDHDVAAEGVFAV